MKARGIWRFVLLYGVVWWGSVMFMLRFLLDYFVWRRDWDLETTLTFIALFALTGSVVGLLGWAVNKAKHS